MIIKEKEYVFKLHDKSYHCALDITMNFIGGKWKTVVLWYLRNRTFRFGELKKQIPDITEKMLSIQLKSLEEDGLIKREVFPEVPLRVEYSLTDFGKSLVPVIESIAKWGRSLGEAEGEIIEVAKTSKKIEQKEPVTTPLGSEQIIFQHHIDRERMNVEANFVRLPDFK